MLGEKSKLIVILANQRSGTTALGQTLGQHPDIKYFGEIFYANPDYKESAFFYFLEQKIEKDKSYIFKFLFGGYETEIFQDYLNYLFERYNINEKKILIDIKLNNAHILNGGWHYPIEAPKSIRILKDYKAKFIFLKRNVLRCYISELVAKRSGIWHIIKDHSTTESYQTKVTDFIINLNEAYHKVKMLYDTIKFYEYILNDYQFIMHVKYQDLFDEFGLFRREKIDEICEFLEIDSSLIPKEPLTEKIIKKLNFIKNLDEVICYFREFDWFRDMENKIGFFEEYN
ncbi:MAG: sulfotransferase domain-containing protein [Thermoplasmata archaeon]